MAAGLSCSSHWPCQSYSDERQPSTGSTPFMSMWVRNVNWIAVQGAFSLKFSLCSDESQGTASGNTQYASAVDQQPLP